MMNLIYLQRISKRIPAAILSISGALMGLTGASAIAECREQKCSPALKATATTPLVVLDFDGDGFSEIVSSRIVGDNTEFAILRSSDNTEIVDQLPEGSPALGDYDGDGKWDLATVKKRESGLLWTIKLSSNGSIATQRFGGAETRALVGCRFIQSAKTSLAYTDGDRVQATELNGADTVRIKYARLDKAKLLGCGSLQNNGLDQLILRAPSPTRKLDEIASVGCSNERLVYRNIREFKSGGVINRNGFDFPIVIALRGSTSTRSLVSLEAVAEVIEYPRFSVEPASNFSSGYFKTEDGGEYGVLRQVKGSASVLRRFIDEDEVNEVQVATLSAGRELVAPQGVMGR